jgi:hypothetical protein
MIVDALGWSTALFTLLAGVLVGFGLRRLQVNAPKPIVLKAPLAPARTSPMFVPAYSVPLYGVVLYGGKFQAVTYIVDDPTMFRLKMTTSDPDKEATEITDPQQPLYLVRTPCDLAIAFVEYVN